MSKMEKEDITHKIIGCAYKMHNKLGYGFLESVYKNALALELNKAGIRYEEEKPLKVYYDNEIVGNFFVDLFADDEIIIELKSVQHLLKEHEVQLVNYLNGLKKELGILINFGPSGVEVKRKYRQIKESGQD